LLSFGGGKERKKEEVDGELLGAYLENWIVIIASITVVPEFITSSSSTPDT